MTHEDFEVCETGTIHKLDEKDIEIVRLKAGIKWIETKSRSWGEAVGYAGGLLDKYESEGE